MPIGRFTDKHMQNHENLALIKIFKDISGLMYCVWSAIDQLK